jgi:hypothetical protein
MTSQTQSIARPASRLLTSLQMQAREYRARGLLLLIVTLLPVVFFAASFYSSPTGGRLATIKVPELNGTAEVQVEPRETWSMGIGILGVAWGVSTIAFFSVMGNLQRDRRLILSGYRSWEILLARLGILVGASILLAVAGMIPYTIVTTSNHPEVVWLANFMGGLIAAGFGLLVGTLLPRPTEGMLIVILVTGVGLALNGDSAKYFFLYQPIQLLVSGRLATDPRILPFVGGSLTMAAAFLLPALFLWWRRTRIAR